MDNYTYGFLLGSFLFPLCISSIVLYIKSRKKQNKFILVMAIIGLVSFFLMMPAGVYFGAWQYDYTKTSNMRIGFGYELLETCIWQIVGCIILAVSVTFFAEREEKKKSLWPFISRPKR